MLKVLSEPFEKFLGNRIKPHPFLEDINDTMWPINFKRRRVTFRTRSRMISKQQLKKKMLKIFIEKGYDERDMQSILVQVSMFSVDWIIRSRKNFLEFSRILRECKNPRIYQTDFIHALVDEFWREN